MPSPATALFGHLHGCIEIATVGSFQHQIGHLHELDCMELQSWASKPRQRCPCFKLSSTAHIPWWCTSDYGLWVMSDRLPLISWQILPNTFSIHAVTLRWKHLT